MKDAPNHVSSLGFRRVDCVRVIVGMGRPFAEVTGVVHRSARTVRVPIAIANRLSRAGVPLLLDDRRAADLKGN